MTAFSWKMIAVLACVAVAACGSDDSDNSGTAGGGIGGSAGSSSGTPVAIGNCMLNNGQFCMYTECTGAAATCDSLNSSSAQACETASGVWTAGAACTTTNSLGSCTEKSAYGSTVNTFYAGGSLTADDYKQMCESKSGTWKAP